MLFRSRNRVAGQVELRVLHAQYHDLSITTDESEERVQLPALRIQADLTTKKIDGARRVLLPRARPSWAVTVREQVRQFREIVAGVLRRLDVRALRDQAWGVSVDV